MEKSRGRFRDPLGVTLGLLGQQILPGSPGFLPLTLGQLTLTEPESGLDVQRAVGVGFDELLVPLGRFAVVVEILIALGDQQLDLDTLLRLGAYFQRLVVEL